MSGRIPLIFATDGIFPHMVGGMQRHSRLLVEALSRTGKLDILVLHPHTGQRLFDGCPGVEGMTLPPLPGKKHYFIELHEYSKRVLEVAEAHPHHLIYSQGLSVWAGLRKVAHRTVVNPHGLEPYQTLDWKTWLKTWPYRRVFNRIFRQAAHTVSLGGRLTHILEEVMGPHRDRIVVLPNATNPVDLPAGYHKAPARPLRFLFAGRFAENKGIDGLLAAAAILHERGLGEAFTLDLVGKGPLWESMQARYQLPGVNFLGFVPDEGLDGLYLDDHVFVLPTLFEGMPTVVLEAMARAMPIIVTDVGATLELVDGANGIIVPKRDPGVLANAMQGMMEMPAGDFGQMSRASLEKFLGRFTWEAVAAGHVELFKRMHARA